MCKELFKTLSQVDLNGKIEEKKGAGKTLKYLSWAWAVAELTKRTDFTYEIKFFEGKPYVYDPLTGYMVFTSITIDGVTKDMWLPVMNDSNKAMLDHPYEYSTKSGTRYVEACTMFDINKTIMRCLVKNMGMFGLGISLYVGDDLPKDEEIALVGENEIKWLKEHNLEDYLKNKKGLKLEECPFDLFVVLKDKYITKYGGENKANQVNGGN